jgi:hypothetical protein
VGGPNGEKKRKWGFLQRSRQRGVDLAGKRVAGFFLAGLEKVASGWARLGLVGWLPLFLLKGFLLLFYVCFFGLARFFVNNT